MMKRLFKAGISTVLALTLMLPISVQAANEEDDKTAQEKYEALVEAGIFEGFEDGSAALDENMTRAQAAKIAALLLGLEEKPASSSVYKDLDGAGWAAGFIGAATEAGILNGKGNGVFDPSADVTREQLAAMMVRMLNLEVSGSEEFTDPVSDWAKGYVATALKAGLISKEDDYSKPATREALVESSYSAKDMLEIINDLSVSASPIDISTLQLSFNKELEDISDNQVTVKSADGAVSVSSVELSEDKKSAIVKHAGLLPSTTYTINYLGKNATITTPDAKLELSPTNTSVSVGGQVTFTAKLTFTIGKSVVALDDPIVWSANSGTITPSGIFTASTSGTATITATAGDYQASATVTVNQPPIYVPPFDTTAPEITEWTLDSVSVGESVYATSTENGTLYFIEMINLSDLTVAPTLSDLNRYVSESEALESGLRTAIKTPAAAGVRSSVSTAALMPGSYYVYAADASGNISDPTSPIVLQPATPDDTPPVLTLITELDGHEYYTLPGESIYNNGQVIEACSDEAGALYVVRSSDISSIPPGSLTEAVLAELAVSHGFRYEVPAANMNISIHAGLQADTPYAVIAVDPAGNLSIEHYIVPALYP